MREPHGTRSFAHHVDLLSKGVNNFEMAYSYEVRERRPSNEALQQDAEHCAKAVDAYMDNERVRRRIVQLLMIGGPLVAFVYALFAPLFDSLPRASFFELWAVSLIAVLPFLYWWKRTSDVVSRLHTQAAITSTLLLDRGLRDQSGGVGNVAPEPWYRLYAVSHRDTDHGLDL